MEGRPLDNSEHVLAYPDPDPHPLSQRRRSVILTSAAVLALAASCAPSVAPATLLAVARAESGLNPLAIHINRGAPPSLTPRNTREAAEIAERAAAAGANFDIGLTQINSANLAPLGLSLADALDPCRSLAASAALLTRNFKSARRDGRDDQSALRTAFSLYNTGDPGSITTIHADSAELAFEQLTLLVKESEGGRDLPRAEIRALLHILVDVVVQMRRADGRFRVSEVWYDPLCKRALAV